MKKREKLKIKPLFIIILLIIIIFIFLSIPKKNNPPKKQIKLTEEEVKMKKLNNINKKIDYFNNDYIDRYISYKEKNPDLSITQVVKNVNMNLDYNYYENTKETNINNKDLILVNKYYYLKEEYVPDNLESINVKNANGDRKLVSNAKKAFEELSNTAAQEGLNIIAMSTYRSYEYQVNLYNRYVENDGKEEADTYSGRPGHSEHQTGLAVDVYNKNETYTNFEKTKEFDWMQENAYKYGFILRFPKGKEKETGYQYESWHYRYVGKEAAKYIKEKDITLEEYHATIIKDW